MSKTTGIEWTDSTWSPIRVRVRPNAAAIAASKDYGSLVTIAAKMAGRVGQHCEHVSPGCENCYAGANNHRCLPGNGTGLPYDRRARDLVEAFVDERVLIEPLKWKPLMVPVGPGGTVQEIAPRPRLIFVENQSDLFGEWVTDDQIDQIFAVMALCPQHTFQVLTKRPERMLKYMSGIEEAQGTWWRGALWEGTAQKIYAGLHPSEADSVSEWLAVHLPLKNVWLGVSDEGNQHARIDLLRRTPAANRFVSAEPLIFDPGTTNLRNVGWVICGGESGPGARPMNPEWARSLRDQCQAAGVAYFMKQMGSTYGPKKGHEPPADLDIKQFPEAR